MRTLGAMKKIIIIVSFVFAMLMVDSCSASRDVEFRSSSVRIDDDGDVTKREKRVDDDGIVIKKRRRDRADDDKDVDVRIKKDRRVRDRDNDEPTIIIR